MNLPFISLALSLENPELAKKMLLYIDSALASQKEKTLSDIIGDHKLHEAPFPQIQDLVEHMKMGRGT